MSFTTNLQTTMELQQTIKELQQTINEQNSTIKKLKKKNKRQYELIQQYQDKEEVDNLKEDSIIKIQRWIKLKILTKNNILSVEEKELYQKIKKYGWNACWGHMRMYFSDRFEMTDENMERLGIVDINEIPFEQLATKLRCIRTKDRKGINKIQMKDMESKVWSRKYDIEQEKEREFNEKYGKAVHTISCWWRIYHPKFDMYNIHTHSCFLCDKQLPFNPDFLDELPCIPKRKRNIQYQTCCTFGKCNEERLKKLENKKENKTKKNDEDPPTLTEEYLMKQTKKRLKNLFNNNRIKLNNWSRATKDIIVDMILKNLGRFSIVKFE